MHDRAANPEKYFITALRLSMGEVLVLPMTLISFSVSDFQFQWYSTHGIDCPQTVRESMIKRQAEFFFGRFAARQALQELGIPNGAIPIGTGGQPIWPIGMTGSLSHTANRAIASVVPMVSARGIGIDIEWPLSEDNCDTVSTVVLTPAEIAYIKSKSVTMSFSQLVTVAFSAKEAFFKAVYPSTGVFFSFKDIILENISFEGKTILFRANRSLGGGFAANDKFNAYFARLSDGLIVTAFALH